MSEKIEAPGMLLDELVRQIRDLINEPRKKELLVRDAGKFNQLCSAMDAIGDAEHAILAHREMRRSVKRNDVGIMYLIHYGLLQALYLQQDASSHLCESLGLKGIDWDQYPELRAVRDTRNDIAHATSRSRGGASRSRGKSFHGIVQATMTGEGFDVYCFSSGENADQSWTRVRCESLVEAQYRALVEVLGRAIVALQQEAAEHKAKFKDQLLKPMLEGLEYPLERVRIGTRKLARQDEESVADVAIGLAMLGVIEGKVEVFVGALAARDWFPKTYGHIDELVQSVREAISSLRQGFRANDDVELDSAEARGLVRLLADEIGELYSYAESLDESYSS